MSNKKVRRYSINKGRIELNTNLNKPQTLEEYFLVIGVDPKICLKDYLYNTTINDLNEYYSKEDFKPKILSKFPPVNKQYINIDTTLIDLCFQDGYKLEKFYSQPKPVVQHFLLDNSFYSIDYPLKYVTCLIIYESLENYLLLNNQINEKLGEEYFNNTWKMNTGKKNKNDIIKAIGNIDLKTLNHNERLKSEVVFDSKDNNNDNILESYSNYYFPKILCLVSTQHYFIEQKLILKQIYQYFLDNEIKKIPIEKKILTILFNIPIPPKGLLEIEYNLKDSYQKVKIKGEKMNNVESLDDELNLILSKFSINKIIIILKYILFENKTIVFSTKINELSFFIYGIISLLFPLHYSFQVSSSIPIGAFDILESISPYILGINTKFRKTFFKENKIDINDLNLFIIDLDEKSIKIAGKDNVQEFPKSLTKPLKEGLEELLGIKKQKIIMDKKEINFKAIRLLFFDFFVNLLSDYEIYLKKDYFKNKLTNTGIKNFFKIKDFIESHPNNEKDFYKKFTETQMFSDFIYKKMIPKNLNEKLEILLVDETLIKKKNKKLFTKKKSTVFLDSKEYDISHIYEIPQSRNLSKREKDFFTKESDRNSLLLYGQKINEEINPETNEVDYSFEYYIFPILNKSFFENPPLGEYFLAPDSILFSDVDRANTDILSKTLKGSSKSYVKKSLEEEMQNYIYLTYIELWAYSYWYLDCSEKDDKFNQMLKILNKITHHEVELFDHLFETLNKFKEVDKILQLYDCLVKYKIVPSSFIYSTVNSLLNRNKLGKSFSNCNFTRLSTDLSNEKKHQKRTFHSMKEGNILGDKVIFYSKQPCPECENEIDMIDISLNFKNMNKEIFWTKCPFCEKNIIPKIGVILGDEIMKKQDNNKGNINTSKYTQFILHSPYELKNNIKNIISKDKFTIFHSEFFKEKYPSLFWSCVWYFKINKIDLDIILPYEWNTTQDWNNLQKSLPNNIESLTKLNINKENKKYLNQIDIKKYTKKIKDKSSKLKIQKYTNDKLIIQSLISIIINDKDDISPADYSNITSIATLFDIYRRSSSSININKSKTVGINKDLRKSSDNSKGLLTFKNNNNFKKLNSMKFSLPSSSSIRRGRINPLTKKALLSPCFRPRKLFDTGNSSDLKSIKENGEDYFFSSPFFKDNPKEENNEDDLFEEGLYSQKISTNIFNFEDDDIDIFGYRRNKSFCKNEIENNIKIEENEKKRNNSVKNKKIDLFFD